MFVTKCLCSKYCVPSIQHQVRHTQHFGRSASGEYLLPSAWYQELLTKYFVRNIWTDPDLGFAQGLGRGFVWPTAHCMIIVYNIETAPWFMVMVHGMLSTFLGLWSSNVIGSLCSIKRYSIVFNLCSIHGQFAFNFRICVFNLTSMFIERS